MISWGLVMGYITADELAKILRRSKEAINNDQTARPWAVPPAYKPPGSRKPLWDEDEVREWIKQHREPDRQPLAAPPAKPRRGRPAKIKGG